MIPTRPYRSGISVKGVAVLIAIAFVLAICFRTCQGIVAPQFPPQQEAIDTNFLNDHSQLEDTDKVMGGDSIYIPKEDWTVNRLSIHWTLTDSAVFWGDSVNKDGTDAGRFAAYPIILRHGRWKITVEELPRGKWMYPGSTSIGWERQDSSSLSWRTVDTSRLSLDSSVNHRWKMLEGKRRDSL